MTTKLPAIQFYPGDWLRDTVAGCSLAAQGLWFRLMFVMHDSERYGYLSLNGSPMQPVTAARRCGCDLAEYESLLAELETAGVPSRTNDGTLYSRRMVRDAEIRRKRAKSGRKGGLAKALANSQQNIEDESEVEEHRSEYSREFELAWGAYGKKGAKGDAQRRYIDAVKRLKTRGLPDPHVWLLGRIRLYLEIHCDRERKFFKDFERWLKDSVYDFDDKAEKRKKPQVMSPPTGSFSIEQTAKRLAEQEAITPIDRNAAAEMLRQRGQKSA
jgi:hypothetical protein